TKRFYHGDESLGRQAQAASERARELAKQDGGGSGPFAQAKRDLATAKSKADKPGKPGKAGDPPAVRPTKRTTPPKNRPTPPSRPGGARSGSSRPGSGRKKPK